MRGGFLHSKLVTRLLLWIAGFLESHPLGEAGTALGFVLARNPDVIHEPDIHFIARDRLPGADHTAPFEGAPDLAVEVLSPDDPVAERQGKICDYLNAGTRLIWIVDPTNRTVMVSYPSGYSHVFSGQDQVLGGDVLPGFSFQPEALFRTEG